MDVVVPINHIAILLCGVASIVVGTLWYGPLFGKQWIALMKFTPEQMAEGKKKGMAKLYALQVVASLVTAYVLAHVLVFANSFLGVSGVVSGIMAGFWSWLGFVGPIQFGSNIWDGRPWKLFALNTGHYLVSLCVMGAILAAMPA